MHGCLLFLLLLASGFWILKNMGIAESMYQSFIAVVAALAAFRLPLSWISGPAMTVSMRSWLWRRRWRCWAWCWHLQHDAQGFRSQPFRLSSPRLCRWTPVFFAPFGSLLRDDHHPLRRKRGRSFEARVQIRSRRGESTPTRGLASQP